MPDDKTVDMAKTGVGRLIGSLSLLDKVLIHWVDAHTLSLEGWVTYDYVQSADINCTVQSLGYFVCVKGEFLVLAMDVIRFNDNLFEDEYNSASAIPISCIKSIEVLTHG